MGTCFAVRYALCILVVLACSPLCFRSSKASLDKFAICAVKVVVAGSLASLRGVAATPGWPLVKRVIAIRSSARVNLATTSTNRVTGRLTNLLHKVSQ